MSELWYNVGMTETTQNKSVIPFRQELFWDVDPATIDAQKNATYVIERILELGDISEMKWLTHYYSSSLIRKILQTSRVVSAKSKNLWLLAI